MKGMNAATGKQIQGIEHLRQSIRDILTTPVGSRVMRRDYGSRLFELVGRPVNEGFLADLYAATAESLDRWEPRLRLTRVKAETVAESRVTLSLEGRYLPEGKEIRLEGIVL